MSDKERLEQIKFNNKHSYCDKNDVDFLLNRIEHQSKEITKAVNYTFELNKEIEIKDKMIEEMSKYIEESGIMHKSVKVYSNDKNSPSTIAQATREEIKEYFRKKVKNG